MDYNIIKEIDLDFYDRKFVSVEAKQYDTNSRYILVTCYNQGSVYVLDKSVHTAYIRYKKKDENLIFNSCTISDDGKILVELTQQMLSSSGNGIADLMVFCTGDEPVNTSTMQFCINVLSTPYPNSDIESQDEFGALEDLMNKALADYEYVMEKAQKSADDAAESAAKAKTSETNAKTSETKAKTSETNAKNSETNAKTSENNAKSSATTATNKATEASNYATEAESYAHGGTGTRIGEDTDNAKYYKEQAASSASSAKTSANNAKTSETNSANSASAAKISETNSKTSETNAANSATASVNSASAAKTSETNAKTSEVNSKASESAAKSSQTAAENSASAAATSATNAKTSENNSKTSETNAKNSQTASATSEKNASASATTATNKSKEASDYATKAQSYAEGGTGTRLGEDTDNAKEYARQAKESAEKATEIAGGNFITQSEKGAVDGVATLDNTGKIPLEQIPNSEAISNTEPTGQEIGCYWLLDY